MIEDKHRLVEPGERKSKDNSLRSIPRGDLTGSDPHVSVVMGVYNGERFLGEAVESILNQTFTDFEFIIVDDGSTDDAWQILTAYAARDDRIRLLRNKANRGVAYSANKGIACARSEYIARMDADDISHPERLARQIHLMATHPEVGLLGGSTQAIDRHGNISSRLWQCPAEHGLIKWRMCFEGPFVNVTTMMRRDLYEQVNGYDIEMGSNAEDYELWQRLSKITRFANLPEVLAYVRQYEGYDDRVSKRNAGRQYQNSLIISQRVMSELLGEEVPLRLVKKVIKHFGPPEFETPEEVAETARLIYRLYRAFVADSTLSPKERQLVRQDAARELYQLFRPRIHKLRAWKLLGWACRVEPLLIGRVVSGKVRRMVGRWNLLSASKKVLSKA